MQQQHPQAGIAAKRKQDSFDWSPTVSRRASSALSTAAASASAASGPAQRTPYAALWSSGALTRNTRSLALQTCASASEVERNSQGSALAPRHARANRSRPDTPEACPLH